MSKTNKFKAVKDVITNSDNKQSNDEFKRSKGSKNSISIEISQNSLGSKFLYALSKKRVKNLY